MVKKLGIGFAILMAALIEFSIHTDNHPKATEPVSAAEAAQGKALYACKVWTRSNSKLAMGDIEDENEVTDGKLPANHRLVEIIYRSRGEGLLMHSKCEYLNDGTLVKAESSLK